jgi:hypothetical protein
VKINNLIVVFEGYVDVALMIFYFVLLIVLFECFVRPAYHAILKYTSTPLKPKSKQERKREKKEPPLGHSFTASFITLPLLEFGFSRSIHLQHHIISLFSVEYHIL